MKGPKYKPKTRVNHIINLGPRYWKGQLKKGSSTSNSAFKNKHLPHLLGDNLKDSVAASTDSAEAPSAAELPAILSQGIDKVKEDDVTQKRKKRAGSSTNGITIEEKNMITSKRVRVDKGFFEDSHISYVITRKKKNKAYKKKKKSAKTTLTEEIPCKVENVEKQNIHDEVDIKYKNEDVTIPATIDDESFGAAQIIDILSKLYRSTFGS